MSHTLLKNVIGSVFNNLLITQLEKTFIEIDGCPTPKNQTVYFIQHGAFQEPEHLDECLKKSFIGTMFQDNIAGLMKPSHMPKGWTRGTNKSDIC